MSIKHNGREVSTWIHKNKEVDTIIYKGVELHTTGNLISADGYILVSADGYILNAKEE